MSDDQAREDMTGKAICLECQAVGMRNCADFTRCGNTYLHESVVNARVSAYREALEDAHDKILEIDNWAEAYPLDIFIEPTKEEWAKVAKVLNDNGFSLSAISASNMRHVITEVNKIAADALSKIDSALGR